MHPVLIATTSMATLQFPAWSMFILFILHVFCDAWSIDFFIVLPNQNIDL